MQRRDLLKTALAFPWLGCPASNARRARARPGKPGWPSDAAWAGLAERVGGRLVRPVAPSRNADALTQLDNPYFVGDDPALTQTSGWLDAWSSQRSAYAVAATRTEDVVAAVNFAREHSLRVVIKGGGHSYAGGSSAPDSLLIWTRHMNEVTLHDAFTGEGCNALAAPQPAVSVRSGAMWMDVYDAVTTRAGRYVQGGGCTTVGVAGLVLGGGFGSWSKNYGTAAAGLLEAEVVTADGQVRVANAGQNPDLFWALKGGGGGSFGVVTRLTLRTRELPTIFGAVFGTIHAASDAAFRALLAMALEFYATKLFNPHWGETLRVESDNVLRLSMVFQGLTVEQATALWAPFIEWVRAREAYSIPSEIHIVGVPSRRVWDPEYLASRLPGIQIVDDRPGASARHVFWAADQGQVGWFIYHYRSAWLPASLLFGDQRSRLADALFEASRHHGVELHFNKGLAGAREEELAAVRNTSMNPEVLDAFALAIISEGGGPAYPDMGQPSPDLERARRRATSIRDAGDALLKVAPRAGAYVSESDFFQTDWQTAFWGANYARLVEVKRQYDPDGLFFVHHGVDTEGWSADGFTRV